MALRRSLSPYATTKTYCSHGQPLKNNCMSYNFRIQSAPPLSLQQYARAFATIPGNPTWQPTGSYHSPPFHSYLSPQIRKPPRPPVVRPWIYAYRRKYSIPTYTLKNYKDMKPKPAEPIWFPTGPYRSKRPTSLSPERRLQRTVHEPIWQPPGRPQNTNLPYFDPPSLRWSLQDLLRSMPDLKSKPSHISRSTSALK